MQWRRLGASLGAALEAHVGALRGREAPGHVLPVPQVPDGLEVLLLLRLVLQVVGVLPGVEHQQREARLGHLGLVVVDLGGAEPLDHGVPDQRRPARAHDGRGGGDQLLLEELEAAEITLDGLRERPDRLAARARSQVLPEEAVQHVSGNVEGELVLERRNAVELAGAARLEQLLDALVGGVHVLAVVLVVVQLHEAAGEVRLQRAVVIAAIGKYVAGHGRLLSSIRAELQHRAAWMQRPDERACTRRQASDEAVDPALDSVFRKRPRRLPEEQRAPQQDQGGNAPHAEARRERLLLVDVHLDHLDPAASLPRDLLERRRHRVAGTAPRRPEVDQHRDRRFLYLARPGAGLHRDRLPREHFLMTASAHRIVPQTGPRDAVGGAAAGAWIGDGVVHAPPVTTRCGPSTLRRPVCPILGICGRTPGYCASTAVTRTRPASSCVVSLALPRRSAPSTCSASSFTVMATTFPSSRTVERPRNGSSTLTSDLAPATSTS